jgi:hypothetical protein
LTKLKFIRAFYFLVPAFLAILAVVLLTDLLRASGAAGAGNGDVLVVVADTTASMQPELNALSEAWPGSVIPNDFRERLFHLIQFRDAVQYQGSTSEMSEFKSWLGELTAAGGGECDDAILQALAAVAREAPDSRALLLSDSAPQGDFSNLAFIMNKLTERGVNLFPIISGWCNDSVLSQSSMFSLARMTGGVATIHEEEENVDIIDSTFDLMALQDTILVENSTVDVLQSFSLILDSTATTLGIDDEQCKVWCLTCPLALDQSPSLFAPTSDIKLMVKNPDGNLLQAGDPGVKITESSGGMSFLIDLAEVYTPKPGETSSTWEVIIEGNGDHVLTAAAHSALHLEYLSEYFLTAKREQIIRARLTTDSGTPAVDDLSVQFYLKHIMNGQVHLITLFDDGQHGDGQAGDGIYGGQVMPKRGLWYLAVRGKLANGAEFQRIDSVPIRVKGFKVNQPPDNQQVPGNSSTIRFQLTNDDEVIDLNQVSSKQYELEADSLLGWASVADVPASIVLAAGETAEIDVAVNVPQDAEEGAVEETYLTIVEDSDIGASETLTVKTTAVDELRLYLPNIVRP